MDRKSDPPHTCPYSNFDPPRLFLIRTICFTLQDSGVNNVKQTAGKLKGHMEASENDPESIRKRIRDHAMPVDKFLALPGALSLVQRNDRVVIDLYVSFLTSAFANTSNISSSLQFLKPPPLTHARLSATSPLEISKFSASVSIPNSLAPHRKFYHRNKNYPYLVFGI